MSAKTAKKPSKSSLKETSVKVGKVLARSSHKVETTREKIKKTAEKMVEDASKKAEQTVSETVDKIKKEVSALTKGKTAKKERPKPPALMPKKGMAVEGHMGFLAGDIYDYLQKNGETEVDKIVNVMKRRKNSIAMIHAALGWLAREAKVSFSSDGANAFTI